MQAYSTVSLDVPFTLPRSSLDLVVREADQLYPSIFLALPIWIRLSMYHSETGESKY